MGNESAVEVGRLRMPQGLFDWEFEPVENRRKKYIQKGGLGGDLNGFKNKRERTQYKCVNCKKEYEWSSDLDFTDFGEVIDNLCGDCRKILREWRTNHPPMGA
jgi:hypothetical protein